MANSSADSTQLLAQLVTQLQNMQTEIQELKQARQTSAEREAPMDTEDDDNYAFNDDDEQDDDTAEFTWQDVLGTQSAAPHKPAAQTFNTLI